MKIADLFFGTSERQVKQAGRNLTVAQIHVVGGGIRNWDDGEVPPNLDGIHDDGTVPLTSTAESPEVDGLLRPRKFVPSRFARISSCPGEWSR